MRLFCCTLLPANKKARQTAGFTQTIQTTLLGGRDWVF